MERKLHFKVFALIEMGAGIGKVDLMDFLIPKAFL
jgi:hypothetical protein